MVTWLDPIIVVVTTTATQFGISVNWLLLLLLLLSFFRTRRLFLGRRSFSIRWSDRVIRRTVCRSRQRTVIDCYKDFVALVTGQVCHGWSGWCGIGFFIRHPDPYNVTRITFEWTVENSGVREKVVLLRDATTSWTWRRSDASVVFAVQVGGRLKIEEKLIISGDLNNKYSGDLKSDPSKSGLFRGRFSNGSNHSKTGPKW